MPRPWVGSDRIKNKKDSKGVDSFLSFKKSLVYF